MATVVIDASMAAAWCFPDEQTEYTNAVLRLVGDAVDPIAPTLWAYEIRNVVLVGLRRGRITRDGAQKLLAFLSDLDVQLSAFAPDDDVFAVAEKYGLTF